MKLHEDFDPTVSDDPEWTRSMYRELRENAPLAYSSAYGGFWALTRYEDVRNAASDSQTYISSVKAVVPSDPRGLRRPPLNFDAPAHTPYRRALDRTLQRARLVRLEPRLREYARSEILPLLQQGGGDIATGFGVQFPALVTSSWLNLEPEVAPILAEASYAWVNAWRKQDGETTTIMSERMYEIARDLVNRRLESPMPIDEDPASSLLSERVDGEPLDAEQIVGALRQSLVVGMVAPPILFGSMMKHLSEDAELQDRLRKHPELIPDALEEFIRLYTPYRGFSRTVSEPVEKHGRIIQPKEPVTLVYSAANRDPEMFPDPDKFVLGRDNVRQHLGFGRGRHRCAGMPLARLMLRVALEELLASTESITTEGPYEFARMPEVGMTSVPVKITARGLDIPHRT